MTRIDASDNVFYLDPKRVGTANGRSGLETVNSRAGLETAAGEFEAMFLQMVLKNMRAASSAVAGEENLLGSRQQQFYQSMADDQLAGVLARRSSLGISEALVNQLGDEFKNEPATVASIDMNMAETDSAAVDSADIAMTAFQQPLNRPLDSEEK